jgi:tRNA modification GTPase
MTRIRNEETICAPATGQGGAISVVRVSGRDSLGICSRIFFPIDENRDLAGQKGYTLLYGTIRADGEVIDDVLVSVFRAPGSYTGEDSVEISCHASAFIRKRILELLIRNGAVAAQPGEFTRRAFMNGKMDLSQAEAVADVIASNTRSAHRVAMNQMRGGFSAGIGKLRKELLDFASLIELELDFGEEDVEFADRDQLKTTILSIRSVTENIAGSFLLGNAIRNGIPVAIVGKPNSGKSTLLNALLSEEKAIVSDIPGTTRDSIEDTLVIDGIEYRFIDTAGLRVTDDVIEKIGIKKTHEKIGTASVVMLLDEIGEKAASINERADEIRRMTEGSGKRLFILINKCDLVDSTAADDLSKDIRLEDNDILLFISARENLGLDRLKTELAGIVMKEEHLNDDVIISNMRHYDALMKVSESLSRISTGLDEKIPDDLIAIDIRQAIHYLGEITGEITTDELLGNIFRNFCIGK